MNFQISALTERGPGDTAAIINLRTPSVTAVAPQISVYSLVPTCLRVQRDFPLTTVYLFISVERIGWNKLVRWRLNGIIIDTLTLLSG